MARRPRNAPPGHFYHVMNRTAGRLIMLRQDPDFAALQRILIEAHQREPLPILAYCLMGNHWHFVVKPTTEGQMSRFFRWLTLTHAVRWRVSHHSVGYGHLYRGRFKAFPIQPGPRLRQVLRYVERNALSADLVTNAHDWPWSSLHTRRHGPEELRQILSPWPHGIPADWLRYVNQPITPAELSRLQTSETRQRPFGDDDWVDTMVSTFGLQHTIRREGRPKKENGG